MHGQDVLLYDVRRSSLGNNNRREWSEEALKYEPIDKQEVLSERVIDSRFLCRD